MSESIRVRNAVIIYYPSEHWCSVLARVLANAYDTVELSIHDLRDVVRRLGFGWDVQEL